MFAVPGGSPADCVVAGMTFLLKDRPADIVLSGVNNGQNLGDIVNCSGTAAGAREGALQGALGIAMSQGVDYEKGTAIDWAVSRRFAATVVDGIRREAGQAAAPGSTSISRSARPTRSRASASCRRSASPARRCGIIPSDNPGKFFIAIPETPKPLDPDNDFHLLMHGSAITVTPVALQAQRLAHGAGAWTASLAARPAASELLGRSGDLGSLCPNG